MFKMAIIEYGLGGYDPTKPNNNIVNTYEDGGDIYEAENPATVTIPVTALDNLDDALDNPATNSIAEIKAALRNFTQELRD
jgi:hypothetical protein